MGLFGDGESLQNFAVLYDLHEALEGEFTIKVTNLSSFNVYFCNGNIKYNAYFSSEYCDLVHKGDSTGNASRMLGLFTSVVFKRTVKNYIDLNAGFSGVIGIKLNEVKGKIDTPAAAAPWRMDAG